MLRLAGDRDEISVVADQIGTPTSALDLADGILKAVASWRRDPRGGLGQTFHLAGTGATSWAELARHVFDVSRSLGGPFATVRDIASSEYPTPAQRPSFSILSSERFRETFGYEGPPWRSSVEEVVRRLLIPPHGSE
jgi:dTDP-4-dehydrorhamnose reductase